MLGKTLQEEIIEVMATYEQPFMTCVRVASIIYNRRNLNTSSKDYRRVLRYMNKLVDRGIIHKTQFSDSTIWWLSARVNPPVGSLSST